MAKDPDDRDAPDEYEYDLAHEATGPDNKPPPRQPVQRQPPSMHVHDSGGDYGYDSAHDMS